MVTIAFPSSNNDHAGRPPPATRLKRDRTGHGGRILIVEDEWLLSTEMDAALEAAGFEIVGPALSADEAVQFAEQQRPDLVLMDITLRGQRDGIDAAIEIYRRFGLRCIFVSAHRDAASRERAQTADPLGWIAKPFSIEHLISVVKEAFGDG